MLAKASERASRKRQGFNVMRIEFNGFVAEF
jgi:hypothetical protein